MLQTPFSLCAVAKGRDVPRSQFLFPPRNFSTSFSLTSDGPETTAAFPTAEDRLCLPTSSLELPVVPLILISFLKSFFEPLNSSHITSIPVSLLKHLCISSPFFQAGKRKLVSLAFLGCSQWPVKVSEQLMPPVWPHCSTAIISSIWHTLT